MSCVLCEQEGGELVWRGSKARVVLVEHERFPGFCRVVWNAHVAEMSDLSAADRAYLLELVNTVEATQRELLAPDKINLAAFGNMVPHLHWHVIPRFRWDTHFPESVWGPAQRPADEVAMADVAQRLDALRARLASLIE
jgi:diadenosine tetraphosphate (Ap4A) HIT family hydrolase